MFGFILTINWSTTDCIRRSVSIIQPRSLKAGPWECTGRRTTRCSLAGSKETLFATPHLWTSLRQRSRVPCTSAMGCNRLNFWRTFKSSANSWHSLFTRKMWGGVRSTLLSTGTLSHRFRDYHWHIFCVLSKTYPEGNSAPGDSADSGLPSAHLYESMFATFILEFPCIL